MNAQLHCKILILLRSFANSDIFTVQLFILRQITSTAGQITSHNCGSQVITPGNSVLWQPHSRHNPRSWIFLWDEATTGHSAACPSIPLVLPAAFHIPLPVRASIRIWEDRLFFILHIPGPRLSSCNENTNQWLTEIAITKRFLGTLLFIQTLILHWNSHLFLMHACTLSNLWKYNFITTNLPQRAKLSQKSIQVCWQKAKC